MFVRIVTGAALAAALLTTSARAEPSAAWSICTDASVGGEQRIKACTAVINARATTPDERAIAFNQRGAAWLDRVSLVVLGDTGSNRKRATADFDEAIRLDPGFRDAYLNRGYAWFTAREWQRAIADYTEAIAYDPDFPRSYALRHEAYRSDGRLALATADLGHVIRLDPKNPEPYRDRGLLWMEQGDHDRAISDFMQAVKLNPKLSGASAPLGRLLINRGDFDRAAAVYSDVIAVDPAATDPLADRGYVNFLRGDYAAAAADLNEAIKLRPFHLATEARALLRYVARVRAGQDADAELTALVQQIMRRYPLFELYLGRGDPETLIKQASTLLARRCEAEFFIGQWQLTKGNRDEARQRLQAATHERCKGIERIYRAALVELKRIGP